MMKATENWAAGDAYEQFMGRWSREIARLFLAWLNLPPEQRLLDLGCGTGALSASVLNIAHPVFLLGLDYSFNFVHYAQSQLRFDGVVADGSRLPIQGKTFDVLVSGIALNFIPDALRAVQEMRRITKTGGVVAAYVWDYADRMEFLRYFWDAAAALDPHARELHEGKRFPICQPAALEHIWQAAGLKDVQLVPLDAVAQFENFESYWKNFTLGKFPATAYASALTDAQRQSLREQLEMTIPKAEDGSITLTIRAWAIRGEV